MKKILIGLLSILVLTCCDNDVYETYSKQGDFTINKIKRSGKRYMRGFYVNGYDKKIRYRNIRNEKYRVGDNVVLNYDSVVNITKGSYEILLQRRLED